MAFTPSTLRISLLRANPEAPRPSAVFSRRQDRSDFLAAMTAGGEVAPAFAASRGTLRALHDGHAVSYRLLPPFFSH